MCSGSAEAYRVADGGSGADQRLDPPLSQSVQCAATHLLKESTLERKQALDRFLAGVERRAFRMAETATGNREDALDLVQDAMMGLVKSYADRSEQEWSPLFYRILHNGIKDWYRRGKVRSRLRLLLGQSRDPEDSEEQADPIQNAPDTQQGDTMRQVHREDAIDRLQSALKTLPERQQQAFLLRTWEGLDVAQTAFAMKCSAGSVKTHYSRALHRLRAMLEDHWP